MKKQYMLLALMLFAGMTRGQTIPPDALANLDAPGGLVVRVGASDVARTAVLNRDGRFLVHFLCSDSRAAEKVSSAVVSHGLAGKATVSVFDGGNLPFIDNVVNLLIVEDGSQIRMPERLRVLTPRSTVLSLRNGEWKKTTKPVPTSIDDWTHNLYDAGNSGVSRDLEAGLPRHMQWTANPRFSRIHDGASVVAMDPRSGKERWRSEPVAFYSKLQQYSGVNMVLVDDVMLYACGSAYPHKGRDYKSDWRNTIAALDARSGKVLWRAPHRQDGIFVTPDLLVADGLVWHAPIDSGHDTGDYVGLDLRTGKVVRDFKCDKRAQMPHHRCYRNRATERFIFTGWTGINIFSCRTGKWDHNYWLRGACRYGVMPANGLLYNTPSVCTCYINAKIKGFNALAGDSPGRRLPDVIPEEGRLVKGPAFAKAPAGKPAPPNNRPSVASDRLTDWPTYRGGPARHGFASTPLSEAYAAGWKTPIGGKLTQPVVAGGSVFVAAYEQHAVYALDVKDGAVKWRFQAGGVVNSPPSIWQGKAIFGCNDGWVYCVGAADGKRVWKYRAAPLDRRIIACENLESAWPVHGSVLVVADPETGKGKVYTVAGRSIFLDGGMRFLVLDAETGAKIAETVMNCIDPDTGKNVQQGHEWPPDLPAGLPDVLSFSNNTIYMGIHLFSTIGFLDDSEMHRSVWMYGKDSFGGCWGFPVATYAHPSGQILSVMGDRVYGYGRQFYNEGNQQFMHLFAMSRNPKLITYEERFKNQKKKDRRGGPYISSKMATVPRPEWSKTTGTYIRALLAGTNKDAGEPDLLFAVGFPEVIDEHDAIDLIRNQQHRGFKVDKIYQKERSTCLRTT